VLRSNHGLIFQSRRFRAACGTIAFRREFITPYAPEKSRIAELLLCSLNEECIWQHGFRSSVEARRALPRWIRWFNEQRPHLALGYLSAGRASQLQRMACPQGALQDVAPRWRGPGVYGERAWERIRGVSQRAPYQQCTPSQLGPQLCGHGRRSVPRRDFASPDW